MRETRDRGERQAAGGIAISRREALRRGLGGLGGLAGLWLAGGARARAADAAPSAAPSAAPKAKAVIQIWLWGGACHLDTFDPKPDAGNDYCGPFTKPVQTNVDGVFLCELLPTLATVADKYALLRGLTHGVNSHETAAYMVQTGHPSGDGTVYPSVGAVVSHFKGYNAGYKGLIPPYIVLTKLQGRFSEAGFLGARCKPFATGGDPARQPFAVEGVVAEGIGPERQRARRELLGKLDTLAAAVGGGEPQLAALAQGRAQAYDFILGDAGSVFDLSSEKEDLRDRYGRNKFGQSCLAARRLVERGVPYVTINSEGWDTHKQHVQAMRRKLPELDKGLATLLQDLSDRGLLASTIVWCSGEFGRTPKIQWEPPWSGGRNHFGAAFSGLLAGGGFKGGRVVGATDERGMQVKERPIYPWDLIAALYERLGIPPDGTLRHPQGKDVRLLPKIGGAIKSGGRLHEIL
jgi:hypothetical protein